MNLLILNSFKGLKKKKIQMLGIIVLVLLSTGIYTTMNSAVDRLEDRYYNYLEENNVEHVSLDVVIDYKNDITLDSLDNYMNNELSSVNKEELQLLNMYRYCLSGSSDACNQNLFLGVEQIFKKYGVYDKLAVPKLERLSKKYDFKYELQKTKITTDELDTINAMPYLKDKKINIPYLVDGKFPEKTGEITILPKYAKINKFEIGDNYKLNGKTYKIVGFAYASDYIYPMLSMNQPIFDEKHNNIVFMNEDDYKSFDGIDNNTYGILLNGNYNRKNRIKVEVASSEETKDKKQIDADKELKLAKEKGDSGKVINLIFKEESKDVRIGINTVVRLLRTDMIQMEFDSDRTFAKAFLYLLLSISIFVIMVITKKRIEDERLQIGVLKSLGYKRYQIAIGYLVYPIVGALIGGILGYGIGVLFHLPLTTYFLSYFTIPLEGFKIKPTYLFNCIWIPVVLLSILSFIISMYMLRKKPLDLLREGSDLKVNLLSKISNKLTKFMSFESRFRYQLASRSFGKLLIVTLTSFCTGMLITLIIVGLNLFSSMIDTMFDEMKFEYMINYNNAITTPSSEDDLILSTNADIKKVLDKFGKEKELKDSEFTATLTGIDTYTKYINIVDEEEHNLIPKLYEEDDSILINQNIKEYMNIDVGDYIIFNLNDKEVKYQVVGVTNQYLNATIYTTREQLSKHLGYDEAVYNMKYTSNKKYKSMKNLSDDELSNISNIFSIEDLRRNIEKQMQTMNSAIYIVIFFASFMVLIIVAVIANIVVEENRKTISLMKVIGYKNNEVSSIVLNVYTPFIIIAYLISIPCMIRLLEWILKIILDDIEMTIPVTMSPGMGILGLVCLLIGYYIAISLSKRALNEVPLAVALKRE